MATFAHGTGGHRGRGDGNLWLLARAAGLSKSQIATAFENDSNLKTDRSNLRSAREALAPEQRTVWGNLFQGAPDAKRAATILEQLKQLQAQRKQIFQQVFGSTASGGSAQSDGSAQTAATVGPTAAASAPLVVDAPRTSQDIHTLRSVQNRQVACNDDDDSLDDSGSGDSRAVDSEV